MVQRKKYKTCSLNLTFSLWRIFAIIPSLSLSRVVVCLDERVDWVEVTGFVVAVVVDVAVTFKSITSGVELVAGWRSSLGVVLVVVVIVDILFVFFVVVVVLVGVVVVDLVGDWVISAFNGPEIWMRENVTASSLISFSHVKDQAIAWE